jgi:hypothetical protein
MFRYALSLYRRRVNNHILIGDENNDPRSRPLMVRTLQVKSKLVTLQREISAIAIQMRSKKARNAAFRQNGMKRPRFAKLTTLAKQDLAAVVAVYRDCGIATAVFCRDRGIAIAAFCRSRGIATAAFCRSRGITIAAFCRNRGVAIAAWIRKLIDTAIRGVSFSANARRKRPISTLESPASPKRRVSKNLGNVAVVLVSACLGLVSACAVFGLVLIVQFRALKTDMAKMGHEFATMKATVNQLERVARQIGNEQSVAASNRNAPKAQLKQPPLVLGNADVQIVRQFIKVPPPQLGVQAKLSVGDDIAQLTASPIPMALADALPNLRGASFSIDRDGSIVIIGVGSNRIDAVIPYR